MKTFVLEGSLRNDLGKKATKSLRVAELIPAVIYGGDGETIHFTVSNSAVRNLVYSPEVFLVDLTIDGKKYKAILKDLQFHAVSDAILHLDFLQVVDGKPVIMDIPVSLQGLAAGVRAGGRISLDLRKLKVKALAENLPERLEIDVTELELGKTVQVVELSFPNLELLNAANAVVCRVQLTRAARGAAASSSDGDKKKK